MLAPACLPASATSKTCASDSTEQGPAITITRWPPTVTPLTRTSLGSGRISRLPGLDGRRPQRFEQPEIGLAALLPHRGDDGLELAADGVGLVAQLDHAPADMVDVRVRHSRLEHDDHLVL